jgi:serine/threonine protein kinase
MQPGVASSQSTRSSASSPPVGNVLSTYIVDSPLKIHIGTYGKVYKALPISSTLIDKPDEPPLPPIVAIKKFKPDKEGDIVTYTGLSQSAIREISLNRELSRGVVLHRAGKGVTAVRVRQDDPAAELEKRLQEYPSDSESEVDRPLASMAQEVRRISQGTADLEDGTLPPCENFARLVEVILEEKSVYMVFEYAEHDLLVRPLTSSYLLD